MAASHYPDALPSGHQLHWYRIEKVLGQGGFGITYLARDSNLDQPVALKEYLPVEFATRIADLTVHPRTDALRSKYAWGLESFISEARTLAKYDHPSIVRVHSVFEFNDTAYMAMRYERGDSLEALLSHHQHLEQEELTQIILLILDGLEAIHESGFIHRDIKPDNIYLREDGSPVLLDFGSARQAVGKSHTLTILVAPGYAPFEQYYSSAGQQGPWTDIYGLGATLYRAIAGVPPVDAIARSKGILGSTRDVLVPLADIARGRYEASFLAAIDHALRFDEKDRPQSIGEWRAELCSSEVPARPSPAPTESTPAVAASVASVDPHQPLAGRPRSPARTVPAGSARAEPAVMPTPPRKLAWAGALVLAIAAGAGGWIYARSPWTASGAAMIETQRQLEQAIADKEDSERTADIQRRRVDEVLRNHADTQDELRSALLRAGKAADRVDSLDAQRTAERLEWEQRESQLTGELSLKGQRLLEIQAESESLQAEARRLSARNRRTERDSDDRAQQVDELERQIKTLRAELARATQDSAELERQLAGLSGATLEPGDDGAAQSSASVDTPPPAEDAAPSVPETNADRLALGLNAYHCKRYQDALRFLMPAADIGLGAAEAKVGSMYLRGEGIEIDTHAALDWLNRAADKNVAEAQALLGVMYEDGLGVRKDDKRAAELFRKAADQGDPEAQARLGTMYLDGRGVAEEDFQAYKYLYAAVSAGITGAGHSLKTLQRKLDVELRREHAEKLAKRFAERFDRQPTQAPECKT